ncbi:MAG: VWA domain-containing protein [Pseudomonadota bacterium]
MIELAWPWLLAAAVLPLLARLAVPPAEGARGAIRIPFYHRVARDSQPASSPWYRVLLAALAWLALVVAAARPQWIDEPVALPATGRDLLLSVDISGSMETADLFLGSQPATRLDVVKNVVGEFLDRRQGDRVGLILFGRRAYLQTPLTFDRATTRQMLDESVIGLAGKETAIGDAIGLAVKRLREQAHDQKVLILLTDGANTAGAVDPLKAAQLAEQEGVRIYTVGVGADEMMVRSLFGARRVNPSADLDEDTLRTIADQTGGRYFRARDTDELVQIYALLDELEPVESDEEVVRPRRELFHWPLTIALAVTGLLILGRLRFRSRRFASA